VPAGRPGKVFREYIQAPAATWYLFFEPSGLGHTPHSTKIGLLLD